MPDHTDRAFRLGLVVIRQADHDPVLWDIIDRIRPFSIDDMYDCPVCGSPVLAPSREVLVGGHLLTHPFVWTRVRQQLESEKVATEQQMVALQRQIELEKATSRRRSRSIPDVKSAYSAAVVGLRRDGVRLTWLNVATRIAQDASLESLDERTLRRWAEEDGLPRPQDMAEVK
jgi:hypothetical protein